MLGQQREMMFFAEEESQIGGQRVDELFKLALAADRLQKIDVGGETGKLQLANATHQAAVNHVFLRRVQRNARFLVDQFANALEVGIAKREFTREFDLRQDDGWQLIHFVVPIKKARAIARACILPRPDHTENDEPQPQVVVAFGLRITNWEPSRLSW